MSGAGATGAGGSCASEATPHPLGRQACRPCTRSVLPPFPTETAALGFGGSPVDKSHTVNKGASIALEFLHQIAVKFCRNPDGFQKISQ